MAKFIECDIERICKNGRVVQINWPINIDLCSSISKEEAKLEWEIDGYKINFHGIGVIWNYGQNKKARDRDFKNIIYNTK